MKLTEVKFKYVAKTIKDNSYDMYDAFMYYHTKIEEIFQGKATVDIPRLVYNNYMESLTRICNTFDYHIADVTIGEDDNGNFEYMTLKYFHGTTSSEMAA